MPDLPTNTTDRLLAVADLIETTPDLWEQDTWVGDGDTYPPVLEWAGRRHLCSTSGCVAGNAVMLTPFGQLPAETTVWSVAGQLALGITGSLANCLFHGDLELSPTAMAEILRTVATLPEGSRSLANLRGLLDPDLYAQLTMDDDDDDDGSWCNECDEHVYPGECDHI